MSEKLENNKESKSDGNGPNDELLSVRLQYAWDWFDFHAKQRMQLFYFFLITTGILVNAFVNSETNVVMKIAVCFLGSLQATGFLVFDFRSRELTRHAENALEKIEGELFPNNYTDARINDGNPLGMLSQERQSKMREGLTNERSIWGKIRKIKGWIRLIEIIVALAFLIGLIFSFTKLAFS